MATPTENPWLYFVHDNNDVYEYSKNPYGLPADITKDGGDVPATPNSPIAVSPPSGQLPRVHYFDNEYHVRELYRREDGTWGTCDLTKDSGAKPAGSDSPLCALYSPTGLPYIGHIYYVDGKQCINQLYFAKKWNHRLIEPLAVTAKNSQMSVTEDRGRPRIHYFAKDNHVHELRSDDGNTWVDHPLTKSIVADPRSPICSVPALAKSPKGDYRIYFVSKDHHIWQLNFSGIWHGKDLTALGKGVEVGEDSSLAVATSEAGYCVYYTDAKHHVHELRCRPSDATWWDSDVTAWIPSAKLAGKNTPLSAEVADTGPRVYFFDDKRNLQQLVSRAWAQESLPH